MSIPLVRLAWLTALAGAAELVLLRLLTRTAIHIPGLSRFAGPYEAVATIGRSAYYVALVLLALTLAVATWELARARRPLGILAAVALAAFLWAAGAGRTGLVGPEVADLVSTAAIACVAITAVLAPPRAPLAWQAFLAAFAASTLLASLPSSLAIGELLFVVWCATSPLALGARIDRAAAVTGSAVAILTFIALGAAASTVKVLLLWNLGVAGYLPDAAYAIAFGVLAATIVALARVGRGTLAAALAMLVIGGLGLRNTYQTGMALAGLALLLASRLAGEPPRRRVTLPATAIP